VAPASDYASFDDFIADITGRDLRFDPATMTVEYESRDQRGNAVTIKLEYDSQRRYRNGEEVGVSAFLDKGLLRSDFVSWDEASATMHMYRPCYGSLRHDWLAASVEE
jgi:hypothetical protein